MPYRKKILAVPRAARVSDSPIQFEAEPYHYAVPDRVLLADLRLVARRLKARSLFQQQYNKHGRFSAAVFRQRFGTWNAALEALHLLPSAPRHVDDETIVRDIRRVAAKLRLRQLPRDVYFREGRYSTTNISRRFGSWTKAVLAAGLTARPQAARHPSKQDLFDNFENLWRSLGRQPRGRDLAPPQSRFALRTYQRRFGTFRKALLAFITHQQRIGKTTAAPQPATDYIRHKTHRDVRAQLRYQVLRRDHFKCRSCGRSPASDPSVQLQVDHIKPWSAGGETVLENLQTLCDKCNVGKGGSVGSRPLSAHPVVC